ncbi:hypothetical protein BGX38DRAFT_1264972 [Terfezia claveryi]|nr:hypothetical protein BGX38DRAFT_1264972 [Terfezia claveryi]
MSSKINPVRRNLVLGMQEIPDGIDSTWIKKVQNEIEAYEQEIMDIYAKIQEAEEGRKNDLKKQMEKEAQR